jgi:5'-methylthioadenosine phosphorylase
MPIPTHSDGKNPRLGIIGGSGLYEMDDFQNVEELSFDTPYGKPSDALRVGDLRGTRVAFLARHGRGHLHLPTEIPYQANIWALKALGCEFVLSSSAVGSLKEEIVPGHMVIIDQFIDRTVSRPRSFFGDGIAGHVGFADPICPTLRGILLDAVKQSDAPGFHDGGTYVCIEGPTFSTLAESHLFRSWGAQVVGMTNLPEARLVREAGMSYATLALATDYDAWHDDHDAVTVEAVIAVVKANVRVAQDVVARVAKALGGENAPAGSPYADAAKGAVMTAPDRIPPARKEAVRVLFGAHLA